MEKSKFEKFMEKYHKGAFVRIEYVSDKGNGYAKETKAVVRFVKYSHIKGVVPSANAKGNPNSKVIVENALTYNSNTGNYLVHCATTNVRSKSEYTHNGKAITKAEFDQATNAKPSKPTKVFTLNLANVVSIG